LSSVEYEKSSSRSHVYHTPNEADQKHPEARHKLRVTLRGHVFFMNKLWAIY
jgi:hypothetical protein